MITEKDFGPEKTLKEKDFSDVLETILLCHQTNIAHRDIGYVHDFHHLVREILPLRVRIVKGFVDGFSRKESLLCKISDSVKNAGQAEIIAFWTKDQYNLALDWLRHKRVLYDSSFSTGKTLLMMNCVQQLLNR